MDEGLERETGYTMEELFQKIGNENWAIALVVCYLPRLIYFGKLILFLSSDTFTQSTYKGRRIIVSALNYLLLSHGFSIIVPTIVAMMENVNKDIYAEQLPNYIIGFVFALWWRSTYVKWSGLKSATD